MGNRWIKFVFTIIAVAIAAVRIYWPELKVDGTTLGLLILAGLPWFQSLIKSAEIPGVGKIEFQDVQAAGEKIVKDSSYISSDNIPEPSYLSVADTDPNMALVGLRIEIEKRIRALAQRYDLKEKRVLSQMLRELRSKNILTRDVASGLHELIRVGNQAAHGDDVTIECCRMGY